MASEDDLAEHIAKLNRDTAAGAEALQRSARGMSDMLDQFRKGKLGQATDIDPLNTLSPEHRQLMMSITARLVRAPMLIPYVSLFLDEKFAALAKATQDVLGPLPPAIPPGT